MGRLTGKTALITGTLQGIGEGITRTFAHHGADLVLLDIPPEIEKLVDKPCDHGHRCTVVTADVHDPASVATAIRHAKGKGGRIDILVNNADVYRLGSFFDMSDEDRDFHIDISIKGVWSVTKTMLPEMIIRRGGRIMMMSSVTGDMVTGPSETVYALTKVAIVSLIKSLTVECAQSGIRVNAICPGYVHTPMAGSITRQSNPENPESVLTEMAKATPMRRLADPLEVSELAVFLALDKSSYLTGIQSTIDGDSIPPEAVSVGI